MCGPVSGSLSSSKVRLSASMVTAVGERYFSHMHVCRLPFMNLSSLPSSLHAQLNFTDSKLLYVVCQRELNVKAVDWFCYWFSES